MTKKDYEKIAAALRDADNRIQSPELGFGPHTVSSAICEAVECIADALAADNPRFDRERFYAAVWGDHNAY